LYHIVLLCSEMSQEPYLEQLLFEDEVVAAPAAPPTHNPNIPNNDISIHHLDAVTCNDDDTAATSPASDCESESLLDYDSDDSFLRPVAPLPDYPDSDAEDFIEQPSPNDDDAYSYTSIEHPEPDETQLSVEAAVGRQAERNRQLRIPFGDTIEGPPPDGDLRLWSGNQQTYQATKGKFEPARTHATELYQAGVGIAGFQETNTVWNRYSNRQFKTVLKAHHPQARLVTSSSKIPPSKGGLFQPGGTALAILGHWNTRHKAHGRDIYG